MDIVQETQTIRLAIVVHKHTILVAMVIASYHTARINIVSCPDSTPSRDEMGLVTIGYFLGWAISPAMILDTTL